MTNRTLSAIGQGYGLSDLLIAIEDVKSRYSPVQRTWTVRTGGPAITFQDVLAPLGDEDLKLTTILFASFAERLP